MIRDGRSPRSGCAATMAVAALFLLVGAAPDDDKSPTKAIPAAEARRHVGERCTVEMTVRLTKDAETRKEIYLDSEADYHDEKNLAVVISYDHLAAFRKAGIAAPADHYKGKKVRVTGKVIDEHEQIRIRVEDPKQIEVVEGSK